MPNRLAIYNFSKHKLIFDKRIKQLMALSTAHFYLEEAEINHAHCGELLYINQILGDMICDLNKKTLHLD